MAVLLHFPFLFAPHIFGFGLIMYFLPTILGAARNKRDVGAIFVLNFFLGWTFFGWIIALVWALKHDHPAVVR
jgi:hypothetical protein